MGYSAANLQHEEAQAWPSMLVKKNTFLELAPETLELRRVSTTPADEKRARPPPSPQGTVGSRCMGLSLDAAVEECVAEEYFHSPRADACLPPVLELQRYVTDDPFEGDAHEFDASGFHSPRYQASECSESFHDSEDGFHSPRELPQFVGGGPSVIVRNTFLDVCALEPPAPLLRAQTEPERASAGVRGDAAEAKVPEVDCPAPLERIVTEEHWLQSDPSHGSVLPPLAPHAVEHDAVDQSSVVVRNTFLEVRGPCKLEPLTLCKAQSSPEPSSGEHLHAREAAPTHDKSSAEVATITPDMPPPMECDLGRIQTADPMEEDAFGSPVGLIGFDANTDGADLSSDTVAAYSGQVATYVELSSTTEALEDNSEAASIFRQLGLEPPSPLRRAHTLPTQGTVQDATVAQGSQLQRSHTSPPEGCPPTEPPALSGEGASTYSTAPPPPLMPPPPFPPQGGLFLTSPTSSAAVDTAPPAFGVPPPPGSVSAPFGYASAPTFCWPPPPPSAPPAVDLPSSTELPAVPEFDGNAPVHQPQKVAVIESPFRGWSRIEWTLDARKLEGKDKQAVSPQFFLDLPNHGLAPFKVVLHPRNTNDGRGGGGFKKAKGKGRVEVKCEGELSAEVPNVVFYVGIGGRAKHLPPRGPVANSFSERIICGLPKAEEEWDFKSVADDSGTFLVCLDFAPPARATAVAAETARS